MVKILLLTMDGVCNLIYYEYLNIEKNYVKEFKFKSSLEKVYIIAEIGVNHNGKLDLAKKMIIEAKDAGANAVKFQTYITQKLCNKKAHPKYQKIN